jgi:biopolymer transport protein TolR
MAKAARRKPMSEINVVPYIDVMLVLLVIFMVAAPLMTQGIKVQLPSAISDPISIEDPSQFLTVSITESGEYSLDVAGEESSLELTAVITAVAKVATSNPDLQVLIEGDAAVPYGVVITLMDQLQQAGIENVGLITQPGER